MQQSHDKAPARRKRQVDYLSQFDITFEFLPGTENAVADALSRIGVIASDDVAEVEEVSKLVNHIDAIRMPSKISADVLAFAQSNDDELRGILTDPENPLKLWKIYWEPTNAKFYAEVSADHIRPYVPSGLRYKIFESFHGLSHISSRITDRVIRNFYVWPDMSQDKTLFCKACITCQKSKITRHNKPAPAHFEAPDVRFQ
uniref:RNA-directed DNA polymerase n=1 Tax=Trichogramma kaykai TaxID=54128 RepID=A0ABD2WBB5_9HYME